MEHFEEVSVGDTRSFGDYDVTAEEITTFAERYDPQDFHVDREAAAASFFGGLVASGWHTAAMTMRMLVDGVIADSGVVGAIGADELRWPNPVRPGDTLHVETEIEGKDDWQPGLGLLFVRVETVADDGRTVQSFVGRILIERREGAGS